MGRRSDLRFVLRFVLLAVAPMAIGGCYAATAGAVLGILSISGSDGGNSGAEPLRVEEISVAPSSTPDRIPIGFQLAGGAGGPLEAQLEYQVVSWFGRPPAAPGSGWQALTFLPGSDPLDGIRPRATASVVWDARRDLQDLSASVEVRIVPLQDGAPGTARSMVMRAGNTPPEVQEVELPHE